MPVTQVSRLVVLRALAGIAFALCGLPAWAQPTEPAPEAPTLLLPAELPAPEAPSLSIGDGVRGELRGGVELPRRAMGLWRLSVVAARDTGWGTRDLVELLVRTGAALQKLPEHQNVPLRVGNLSSRRGGEIRWSHSHRSGRDADLALYAVDAEGQPLAPDEFITFDRRGEGKYRRAQVFFDVPRNWQAVRAILTDSQVQVQHLFLAEPLRDKLLVHARASGEPEWLIQRARLVLSEPGHSGRHEDHVHVRLYCSRNDRLAGCSDDEPRWAWVQGFDHEVRRQVGHLIAELGEPDEMRRADAIRRLTWFQQRDARAVDALVHAAAHDTAANRRIALESIGKVQEPRAFSPLVRAARAASEGEQVLELLLAALYVAAPAHAAEVLGLLAPDCGAFADRLGPEARGRLHAAVAQTVRPWLLEESAAPLVGILHSPDVTARRAALHTLEHLANRRFRHAGEAAAWFERAGSLGRLHWMHEGFALRDLAIPAAPLEAAPVLIGLVGSPDASLAANAEALLRRIVEQDPGELAATAVRRQRAWARWWDVHRQRYDWSEATRRSGGAKQAQASGATPKAPASGEE